MTDSRFASIIGCPRSGTTYLLRVLAEAGEFAYVGAGAQQQGIRGSTVPRSAIYRLPFIGHELYLRRPALLEHAARVPRGRGIATALLPEPVEPWLFLSELIPEFRPEFNVERPRDPSGDHLTDADVAAARDAIERMCRLQRSPTFLTKYTDFPRIAMTRRIFPNAKFVHIERAPEPTAASYAQKIESGEFGTWHYRDWWALGWTDAERSIWEANEKTPLRFAAHNRNFLVSLNRAAVEDDPLVHSLTYEDLMQSPVDELAKILDFLDVDSRIPLERLVAAYPARDSNHVWRARLSDAEQQILTELCWR